MSTLGRRVLTPGLLASRRQLLPVAPRCQVLHFRSYSQHRTYSQGFWQWLRAKGVVRPLVISSTSLALVSTAFKRSSSTSVGQLSQPALSASVPVELSRVMQPDDANPNGNVHGGTILKLIEQAGYIVATRHCNKGIDDTRTPLLTVLARVDHMDFHQPGYIGEVAHIQAAVTYTSPHSIEVTVDVWAENVLRGIRRHTNTATLWYIAVPGDPEMLSQWKRLRAVAVPQLEGLSKAEQEKGRQRYLKQKAARQAVGNGKLKSEGLSHYQTFLPTGTVEEHTVLASQSTLATLVLPSDCTMTRHLTGGSLMKLMDSVAGICAARHCNSRVVTACIDAIDFHSPILLAEVVFVTARVVFTSAKSMEIEVMAEAEGIGGNRRIANTAHFTFVSLGENKRAAPVPQLVRKTEEEEQRFEEGRRRYEERKKMRQEEMQSN